MPDINSILEAQEDKSFALPVNIKNTEKNPVPVKIIDPDQPPQRPKKKSFVLRGKSVGTFFTVEADTAWDVVVKYFKQDGSFTSVLQIGDGCYYKIGSDGINASGEQLKEFGIPLILVAGEHICVNAPNPEAPGEYYIQLIQR